MEVCKYVFEKHGQWSNRCTFTKTHMAGDRKYCSETRWESGELYDGGLRRWFSDYGAILAGEGYVRWSNERRCHMECWRQQVLQNGYAVALSVRSNIILSTEANIAQTWQRCRQNDGGILVGDVEWLSIAHNCLTTTSSMHIGRGMPARDSCSACQHLTPEIQLHTRL